MICESVNLFLYKLHAKYITASTALNWNYFLSNDLQEAVNSFGHAWYSQYSLLLFLVQWSFKKKVFIEQERRWELKKNLNIISTFPQELSKKILGLYEDDHDVSKYKSLDEMNSAPACMVAFSWLLILTGQNFLPLILRSLEIWNERRVMR